MPFSGLVTLVRSDPVYRNVRICVALPMMVLRVIETPVSWFAGV